MDEWLNTKNFSWKGVLVGMSAGIVFGFIDNAGLWFGMDALDPFIPSDDAKTIAGWGNTYSDMLGATLGTFVGNIIIHYTHMEEVPLLSNAV